MSDVEAIKTSILDDAAERLRVSIARTVHGDYSACLMLGDVLVSSDLMTYGPTELAAVEDLARLMEVGK